MYKIKFSHYYLIQFFPCLPTSSVLSSHKANFPWHRIAGSAAYHVRLSLSFISYILPLRSIGNKLSFLIAIKARIIAIFILIALSLFSIPLNMATPCSVNAKGGKVFRRLLEYVVTDCDHISLLSWPPIRL